MKLLTLDLSSNTGWTIGPLDDSRCRSGDYRIKPVALGPFFDDFEAWLQPMLGGIDICAYETPIMPRITQFIIVQKLSGLASFVEWACHKRGIRAYPVNNQKLKKFMGDGWMSKDQMFNTVKMFGYKPKSYDEADAIALRLYTVANLAPRASRKMNLDLGLLGAAV